ncbi:hypothetical protein KKB40_05170 [Patescibacteria group bacterium]|nr:hypothetical protein [Patescibacteria group bacterium]
MNKTMSSSVKTKETGVLTNYILLGVCRIVFYAIGGLSSFGLSEIMKNSFSDISIFPLLITTLTFSFLAEKMAQVFHKKKYNYKIDGQADKLRKRIEIFSFASVIFAFLLIATAVLLAYFTHQNLSIIIPAISYIGILFWGYLFFIIGSFFVVGSQHLEVKEGDKRIASFMFVLIGVVSIILSLIALLGGFVKAMEFLF